ncbi:hypothetical protein EXU85_20130 [Spirosoma sp. KCTC 42546]|uniref:hypothetical protein n=1 Tax=Spirosoma sp. KCTC 42546 TaxID=2520506 RepID=UPI00115BFBE1|nr:hypothetical protein [Spirosoma sp. KCTC 42546]QDK80790.1 hypothetical protein EXU85_20130 [Spirosoma sp. KCTC 42546]
MNINLPTLLDVAIGLVFIFFVFSIFVSGMVELINTFLGQRAKLLRRALEKILGKLADDFFDHKLTEVKEEKFWGFLKPVNYLSADSFSTVLIDILAKSDVPIPEGVKPTDHTFEKIKEVLLQTDNRHKAIKELIRPILAKSNNFQTFKDELEKWYNGYMEQVSGWFKRYAQGVVWIVAVLVAVLLNVDTIYLTNRLFTDSGLRDKLVAEAIKTTQDGGKSFEKDTKFGEYLHEHEHEYDAKLARDTTLTEPGSKTTHLTFILNSGLTDTDSLAVQTLYVRFIQDRITDLKLPIGWKLPSDKSKSDKWSLQPGQSIVLALLGWLLTASALSFGAPFWFDLLLKLVNIRNTARKPPGNPDPDK